MRTIVVNMVDRQQYDENESGQAIETTHPAVIQVEAIRTYYARKGGRTGSRITFTDGGGFAVSDSFETLHGAIVAALNGTAPVAVLPASARARASAPEAAPAEAEALATASAEAEAEAAPAPRNGRGRRR